MLSQLLGGIPEELEIEIGAEGQRRHGQEEQNQRNEVSEWWHRASFPLPVTACNHQPRKAEPWHCGGITPFFS